MTLLAFDTVFGIPSHPLVVHAAVVLVPLAALALVATGWRAAWRRVYYLPITLMAVAGAGAAFVAKQTGESLQHSLRAAGKRVGDHPQHGNIAFVAAFLFAAACVALYVYQTYGEQIRARLGWSDRFRLPVDEQVALYVAAIPFAALAVFAMVIAGHSGATLVWKTNK
jgi:uncharacterized membrane protein